MDTGNLARNLATLVAILIAFVNAHTLNLAAQAAAYRDLSNRAACVFGDGTGVRWSALLRGVRMKANLNGTDLVPRLFACTADRGYRYFLLGATEDTIARAASNAHRRFAGWTLAGSHHGYIDKRDCPEIIELINAAQPHVLLVGMGNPLQERWIDDHLGMLQVPLCLGTGGLFDHWAGNLRRAPAWVRHLGYEWAQLLMQQPHKWRRYLLGNPRFLWQMMTWRRRDVEPVGIRRRVDDYRSLTAVAAMSRIQGSSSNRHCGAIPCLKFVARFVW
jgi:N-acetylglucosaminyldiphosphoundecaprenol N-acetyl-beta-D-mannosaminyltransferase